MNIEKGDTVKITIGGFVAQGVVLSAENYDFGPYVGQENWYIELDSTSGDIKGYTYWKQGPDGGTVEKVD